MILLVVEIWGVLRRSRVNAETSAEIRIQHSSGWPVEDEGSVVQVTNRAPSQQLLVATEEGL